MTSINGGYIPTKEISSLSRADCFFFCRTIQKQEYEATTKSEEKHLDKKLKSFDTRFYAKQK